MYRSIIAASAFIVGLSSAAFAADRPSFSAPMVPEIPFTWTGLYAGGEAAYNWNAMPFTLSGWCDTTKGTIGGGGVSFGPVAGARYQFDNNIVVGIFGSYDFGSSKKDDIKFGNVWHADGQVGYAFGRVLPYLSAGIVGTSTLLESSKKSAAINRTGWSAGGGIDYALADNIIVGAYGRYNDLGSNKVDFDRHTAMKTSLRSEEVGVRALFKF